MLSSHPLTLLHSPTPPFPPTIIFVEENPRLNEDIKELIRAVSPNTGIFSVKGPRDFAKVLKMHGATVTGIVMGKHLKGKVVNEIAGRCDETLGREVPFLVLSGDTQSPTSNVPLTRLPVATLGGYDDPREATLKLLNAIATQMSG